MASRRCEDQSPTSLSVLRRAVAAARENDVPILAQALAYSLFLAIPACALVVLGVFSLLASPSTSRSSSDAPTR